MKIKANYFIIPAITIFVAVAGSFFTRAGMAWYDTMLIQPALTPPKWAFPIAWNTIFILTTISALIIWNKKKAKDRSFIIGLFLINAALNIMWSLLFFQLHLIAAAFTEMFLLIFTLILLVLLIWKTSKTAALLLLPYLFWVSFATYLTYQIWILN